MVALSDSDGLSTQSQPQQSTPLLLRRRVRSIMSEINSTNAERVVSELVPWISCSQPPDPSILECVADTVLEDITERKGRQPSDLAHFSYTLSVALPTYCGILQSRLQSQFLESAQFLASNRSAGEGSWPELVALVGFAGGLCTAKVIPPDVLLDIYFYQLSGQPDNSELELEAVCALFKVAGPCLWNDPRTSEVLTREMQLLQEILDGGTVSPLLLKKLMVRNFLISLPS